MWSDVKKISLAMSLRTPQEEALSVLDKINSSCDFLNDSLDYILRTASEHSLSQKNISCDFSFPSFCFDMTTGIGKTRLMGACIYYLYKTKRYKHFFILTPGNTIYDKLRMEALPESKKYLFKGLESVIGNPKVYDGENYHRYKWYYSEAESFGGEGDDIELFVFNIGKIFNSSEKNFDFHEFDETLGASFSEVLAGYNDLVMLMDEAHRYYAPASMAAISTLKPILGLEFTATPKKYKNVIYSYGLNEGAGKFLKIPVVLGRTNMGGYSAEDIEQMKIIDGLTLHENRKLSLARYCNDNQLPLVKPIVLIACKDTEHAKKIHNLIENDNFFDGKYKGKVMEVHSKMSGEESEENIKKLLSIESTSNKIEIVLHVYKLKEGWDVNNLYTIIPLNAAKSDILALQTIGRGLRLPFGTITGDEEIDTLDIVAHDHYKELLDDIKNNNVFKAKNLDEEAEPRKQVVIQSLFDDEELGFIENLFVEKKPDINDIKTIEKLYEEYQKTFAPRPEKKEQKSDHNLFNYDEPNETQKDDDNQNQLSIKTDVSKFAGQKKIKTKDEFIKSFKKYKELLISTPRILVTPTSKMEIKSFVLKRNIMDFDIAASKIERYDSINKELLSSFDALALIDDNPRNTLACMLLDMPELSSDDADFILDMVDQYLALIEGSDEDKKKIVRRYAKIIFDDISKQIRSNIVDKLDYKYQIQKDIITFKRGIKNIKQDGIKNIRKPFDDKKNIRKYVFEGYKKSYYEKNSFDSDTERIFSIILEDDKDVLKWIRLEQNQLGIFWKNGQYNPDFLVETDTDKYIIEVKGANEKDNPDVISKAQEAIKWCEYASQCDIDHKKWGYRLILDENIKPGNTFKFTIGLAQNIK